MPRFTDQAICIRHLDWSETSQIVALLTREHGKVRGLARGAKRLSPSSVARYSGGIELLTRGEVSAIIRPSSDLANLTEWDLQEPYRHLRMNLEAQRVALYAADLAGALLADHDPHPRTFAALARLLSELAGPENLPVELLRFQWELLTDAGYQPRLDHDARTGEVLEERPSYTFDAHAGGLVSGSANGSGAWPVRRETVDLLRETAAGEAMGGAKPQAAWRANQLLCVYARALLDRELPTMEVVLKGGAAAFK